MWTTVWHRPSWRTARKTGAAFTKLGRARDMENVIRYRQLTEWGTAVTCHHLVVTQIANKQTTRMIYPAASKQKRSLI